MWDQVDEILAAFPDHPELGSIMFHGMPMTGLQVAQWMDSVDGTTGIGQKRNPLQNFIQAESQGSMVSLSYN
ncbi:hypothetical protein AWENTII_009032 [Aspergillus wentii]